MKSLIKYLTLAFILSSGSAIHAGGGSGCSDLKIKNCSSSRNTIYACSFDGDDAVHVTSVDEKSIPVGETKTFSCNHSTCDAVIERYNCIAGQIEHASACDTTIYVEQDIKFKKVNGIGSWVNTFEISEDGCP